MNDRELYGLIERAYIQGWTDTRQHDDWFLVEVDVQLRLAGIFADGVRALAVESTKGKE